MHWLIGECDDDWLAEYGGTEKLELDPIATEQWLRQHFAVTAVTERNFLKRNFDRTTEFYNGRTSDVARGVQTSDVFFQAENAPKPFSTRALPRTPLG